MDLVHVEALEPADTAEWRPGDAFLGGGTWLFSEPQPDVHRLLDLTAFGWEPFTRLPDGGLEIAATTTLADIAAYPNALFGQCCDALLGSFKVWNTATIGGNLCMALPAGPMISLSAALDGTCVIWRRDNSVRNVSAAAFVLSPRRTVLQPGEILRTIRFPGYALAARTAFRQVSLTPVGRSAALVIGRVDADGTGTITVTASTPRPYVLRFRRLLDPAATVVAVRSAIDGHWHADVHGDPRWRAALTEQLVAEIVRELA
jgi:CO/xanthine dehydrogenase FAD-binding subunit